MEDSAFKKQAFTEREAYLWMLENAVFKDQKTRVGDYVLDLKRGQLSFSIRFLAEKWGWSTGAARGFFTRLQKHQIINTASNKGITVITICNYDEIQDYDSYINTASNKELTNDEQKPNTKKNKGITKDKKRKGDFPNSASSFLEKESEPKNKNNLESSCANATNSEFASVMKKLKGEIGSDAFFNWFGDIEFDSFNEKYNFINLKVKNEFIRGYIESNYLITLENIWKATNPKVKYVTLFV